MAADNRDPWWEVLVNVPHELADDAGALFISEGALGCEQLSKDMPSPVFNGKSAETLALPDAASTMLRVSFAGVLDRAEVESRAHEALSSLGLKTLPSWHIDKRTDVDWSERWKEFFRPLAIGHRLWIVPAWERDFHPPADGIVLVLDPGLAFGTGQHATTALCLELMEQGLGTRAQQLRVLDVGCGSGILAIAAAKLGCRDIVAIDNDPTAVVVAKENLEQNDVAQHIRASEQPLAEVAAPFDWVVANLVTPILVELAVPLIEHVKPSGTLVISGVLASQEAEVYAALVQACVQTGREAPTLVERRQRDEWIALQICVGDTSLPA